MSNEDVAALVLTCSFNVLAAVKGAVFWACGRTDRARARGGELFEEAERNLLEINHTFLAEYGEKIGVKHGDEQPAQGTD